MTRLRNKPLVMLRHPNLWGRLRHCRGEGIHSPFLYELVRKVFMCRKPPCGPLALYEDLVGRGVKRNHARQIQNLFSYGGYEGYEIDPLKTGPGKILYIFTPLLDMGNNSGAIFSLCESGTICLLCPRHSRKRYVFCMDQADTHPGLSVDRTGYMLYFNEKELSKQHIKL